MKDIKEYIIEGNKSVNAAIGDAFLDLYNTFVNKGEKPFKALLRKYTTNLKGTDTKLLPADFTELFMKTDNSKSYYQYKSEFWPGDEHVAVNSLDDQIKYIVKWYSDRFNRNNKDMENKYKRYCNSLQ